VGRRASITDSATRPYSVDTVDELINRSKNVSSHGDAERQDDTRIGVDRDVPSVERVNRANVDLYGEDRPYSESGLTGRRDEEFPGSMDGSNQSGDGGEW